MDLTPDIPSAQILPPPPLASTSRTNARRIPLQKSADLLIAERVEVLITLKSWYSNEDLRAEDDDGYNRDDGPLVVNVDSSNS